MKKLFLLCCLFFTVFACASDPFSKQSNNKQSKCCLRACLDSEDCRCCMGCWKWLCCCCLERTHLCACCLCYLACTCPCDTIKGAAMSFEERIAKFPKWYTMMNADMDRE